MKSRKLMALFMGAILFFAMTITAVAQGKGEKKSTESRVSGTILRVNKDAKTITVRTSSGNIERQVVYGDSTKLTKQNEPGPTYEDLKEGTRVICLGKYDEKNQLIADRIDIRLPR